LDQLRAELQKLAEDAEGIVALADKEKRDLTPEEITKTDELAKSIEAKRQQVKAREVVISIRTPIGGVGGVKPAQPAKQDALDVQRREAIPATVRRSANLRAFRDVPGLTFERRADERAYRFGRYCQALMGSRSAGEWCQRNGIELRLYQEDVNTTGGYLVPEEFGTDMIRLVEERGVFRRYANIVPMMSDTKSNPRRTGGLTAYFVAEGAAGTESTGSWDRVGLIAKSLMVLTRLTQELSEDASISVGDSIAEEMAYAFAAKEDDCGFNGDGTSTYGGINGVKPKIVAATASIFTAATGHDTWPELTLADFSGAIGLLPQYADMGNAAWFCHRTFWASVMEALAAAAGGNTKGDIAGPFSRSFLGYPVVISQVLPSTTAVATVCAYLGDLRMSADFGDRRGITIAMSDQASVGGQSTFERNEIAMKATERFDINVHDVGTTAVAGPIVGFATAA
jgi:HK97 family phage major capsid protein